MEKIRTMKTIKTICHLTTVHTRYDIRIFLKEASFLARDTQFEINLIVADEFEAEIKNNVHIFSIGKPKSRLHRFVFSSFRILKAALKIKSDCYHLHDPEIFWLIIPLKMLGKKVVFDLHEDLPAQILSKPYLKPYLRKIAYYLAKVYDALLFPFADYLITATPYIKDINKNKNSKIECLSNYPIKSEFKPEKIIDKTVLPKSVCYTGAISSIRGVGYLIDAVVKSNDDWVLHLAGPIGDKAIEKKLQNALKSTSRIKYWGKVDRSVLADIFSVSSAGFVPFLNVPNHVNAVPNKLFEYMSAGLPIVCSNFKYWNEIITDSQTGLLIPPENCDAIIESIKFIFENPDVAKRFGANGLYAIENKFNWESEFIKLKYIYEKAI